MFITIINNIKRLSFGGAENVFRILRAGREKCWRERWRRESRKNWEREVKREIKTVTAATHITEKRYFIHNGISHAPKRLILELLMWTQTHISQQPTHSLKATCGKPPHVTPPPRFCLFLCGSLSESLTEQWRPRPEPTSPPPPRLISSATHLLSSTHMKRPILPCHC